MTTTGGNRWGLVLTKGLRASYSLISINSGASVATDTKDTGFYITYGTGSVNNYSGIYRNATTKLWTFFNTATEPNPTTGAVTGASVVGISAGAASLTSLTVSSTTTLTGNLTTSAQILAANGSVTAPGYAFLSESNTGIYRLGAGEVAITCLGTLLAAINATRLSLSTGIYAPNAGSQGSSFPVYSFTNSTNTGLLYNGSAMVFVSGGVNLQTLTSSSTTFNQKILTTATGTASVPDIGFNAGSFNSGFYYSAGPTLNVTIGGVRQAYFDGTNSFTATSVSTGTLTGSGAITVGQNLLLGSNNLTTTGTVSTGTLTSAGTLQVTAASNFNSNNISGVASLSLATLTGPSAISVSQNVNMGAFTLTVDTIASSANLVTFDSSGGLVAAGNFRGKISSKTASYTLVSSDNITVFNLSGTATCTLPLVSTVQGLQFIVMLVGTGVLTVACSGGDTINNAVASVSISRSNSSIRLTPSSVGSYWMVI